MASLSDSETGSTARVAGMDMIEELIGPGRYKAHDHDGMIVITGSAYQSMAELIDKSLTHETLLAALSAAVAAKRSK